MDLKELTKKEIIKLIKSGKVGAAELTDSGICPTCFNKENNGVLFGDDTDKTIYEDDLFVCILVGNPRAIGHAAIITKTHYKDMLDISDELCSKIFVLAKKVMQVIKEVYGAESVYLCTMSDGPMNHFHLQLIPRYFNEKRGSINFVKERFEYVEDKDKINELRDKLKVGEL